MHGKKTSAYRVSVGKREGMTDVLERGESGRIILKIVPEEQNGKVWSELIRLKLQANGGLLFARSQIGHRQGC